MPRVNITLPSITRLWLDFTAPPSHTCVKGAVCFPAFFLAPERIPAPWAKSVWSTTITRPLRVYYLCSPQSDNKCTVGGGVKEHSRRGEERLFQTPLQEPLKDPWRGPPPRPGTLGRSRVEKLCPASPELFCVSLSLSRKSDNYNLSSVHLLSREMTHESRA